MAYMSTENKQKLAPGIKAVLKKYGVKGTIAKDRFTLIVNIASGPFDFFEMMNRKHKAEMEWKYPDLPVQKFLGSVQVNQYHLDSMFEGEALEFLKELAAAMNVGNWDKSDSQSDYFNVGWYIDINIGKWNKPYVLVK